MRHYGRTPLRNDGHPKSGEMPRLKAKKSLGQNFLTSKVAIRDMVDAANIIPGDLVLEIGPGKGALTTEILSRGGRVIAIEKDDRMIPLLKERFSDDISRGALSVVHGDIVGNKVWKTLVREYALVDKNYSVVANIPYYITGLLFRLFLKTGPQPKSLIFLVQKEVAQSAVGKGGKESILSLSLKAYGTPRNVRKVERKLFSPQPKVDSAILAVSDISRRRFATRADERRFFDILHAGFSSKRKTLANNLSKGLGKEKSDIERLLASLTLPPAVRAEDVGIDDWIRLSLALS
jgi:16S rRNA (adenine1518-N6/adenine1519-N6)-dimethyltransferase